MQAVKPLQATSGWTSCGVSASRKRVSIPVAPFDATRTHGAGHLAEAALYLHDVISPEGGSQIDNPLPIIYYVMYRPSTCGCVVSLRTELPGALCAS